MADEGSERFCCECGCEIEDGLDFCTQCGAKFGGTPADEAKAEEVRRARQFQEDGRINMVAMLITVYAMPALIMGFIAIFNVDVFTDSFVKDEQFAKFMKDNNITVEMLRLAVLAGSWMSLGSGICATVSSVFCRLRTHWLAATVLCFAAALLCIWSLFGMIFGIFVGWMLMTSKSSFERKE